MDFIRALNGRVRICLGHMTADYDTVCEALRMGASQITHRATFKIFGDDRIILISDSMRATGMPDGESELGGQTVFKNGRYATLADGTLAGSVTNLMDCVRRLVKEMGIPLESAVKCAAANPAKAVGIYENYGSLTRGKYANVVILGSELELKMVCHHGEIV